MPLPSAVLRRDLPAFPRWVRRCRAVARVCVVVLPLITAAACGTSVPRPVPGPARVWSNYERATGNTIRRDCGYSSPLPGRPGWSLWLFCDTVTASARAGMAEHLILGTDTAAAGPYRAGHAPARLSEIPTPPTPLTLPSAGAPQPFLPVPPDLVLPDTTLGCTGSGAYPASWISGVARQPSAASSDLLISYDNYCVAATGEVISAEGFGLVDYDPASNLLGPTVGVFSAAGLPLPPQQQLGSPVFTRDGYLYLFGYCRAGAPPGGCGRGQVFGVRTVAQPAYWQNPLSYQYWTGSRWSPDAAAARTLIPASHPLGIAVGDYTADGHGLVMVEQTGLAGDYQVWQARSPAGPWRRVLTGTVPCRGETSGGLDSLCRAFIGHPELSTRSDLVISYYDPGSSHVWVSAHPW
jgi:hypothetical protein